MVAAISLSLSLSLCPHIYIYIYRYLCVLHAPSFRVSLSSDLHCRRIVFTGKRESGVLLCDEMCLRMRGSVIPVLYFLCGSWVLIILWCCFISLVTVVLLLCDFYFIFSIICTNIPYWTLFNRPFFNRPFF